MKQFKYIIFGLVFGVAGFLIGLGVRPGAVADDAELSFQESEAVCAFDDSSSVHERSTSMMIDTDDALLGFSDIALKEGDTVYSVLSSVAQEHDDLLLDIVDYGDLGVFINAINNKQSGDNNNYWQYWVNNQYADLAADKYVLKQGDVIFWKFTSNKYETYR